MEEELEDPADRLIIDETSDNSNTKSKEDNRSEDGEEVPQCQGCQQKAAQFVCAGCGNQWYCSRDCQVLYTGCHIHVNCALNVIARRYQRGTTTRKCVPVNLTPFGVVLN